MNFKVPKFLERETKVFSFLTFKQLIIISGIGVALFILYYILPRLTFFFIAILTAIFVFIFSFVRIEGFSLGQLILRFFSYSLGSKKYFWRKKETLMPIRLKIKEKEETKKETEPAALKISPESRLKKLSSKIDLGMG